jgi:hypothetical protein
MKMTIIDEKLVDDYKRYRRSGEKKETNAINQMEISAEL